MPAYESASFDPLALCWRTGILSYIVFLSPLAIGGEQNGESVTAEQRELRVPAVSEGSAGAGKRVAITAPEYAGTRVHHMLYLPADWKPVGENRRSAWPVVVEYTGNHYPASGSTGRVEDAALGYGITGGRFIWITLPYVSADQMHNEVRWWGDVRATVEYARVNVPRICADFGGDPNAVFLCGFSRGAIAANLIGLHDDEIAKLWCAFVTHDHYDGVRHWNGTSWGSPLDEYRRSAKVRLDRLNGRPVLVCQNGGTDDIEQYLRSTSMPLREFTFVDVNTGEIFAEFPNEIAVHPHTDRWLLKDSAQRHRVWAWIDNVQRRE